MKGLRLVDLYASIQGEGPRTGMPTMFVRFGGCNMRCPGWPCDTEYAIDPKQWRFSPVVTVDELCKAISKLPPVHNFCITGGEPFMQPAEALDDFANFLTTSGKTIDIFTNGSLKMFPLWTAERHVSVIMDWKLGGSGESNTGISIREENIRKLGLKDWVKFVIASDEDFDEALQVWEQYRGHTLANFTVGSAWQHISEKELADKLIENQIPWKLNVQVHKYIYDPAGRQI